MDYYFQFIDFQDKIQIGSKWFKSFLKIVVSKICWMYTIKIKHKIIIAIGFHLGQAMRVRFKESKE